MGCVSACIWLLREIINMLHSTAQCVDTITIHLNHSFVLVCVSACVCVPIYVRVLLSEWVNTAVLSWIKMADPNMFPGVNCWERWHLRTIWRRRRELLGHKPATSLLRDWASLCLLFTLNVCSYKWLFSSTQLYLVIPCSVDLQMNSSASLTAPESMLAKETDVFTFWFQEKANLLLSILPTGVYPGNDYCHIFPLKYIFIN